MGTKVLSSSSLMAVALLFLVGCLPEPRSAGRAEYSQRQVGADLKAPQRQYQQSAVRMADLKEQIQTHFELYQAARRSADPFEQVQAAEAAKFGVRTTRELEGLCEDVLSRPSIVNNVEGAEEFAEDYLDYARRMRARFGNP